MPKPVKEEKDDQDDNKDATNQPHNFLKHAIGGKLCNETRSLEPNYPYVGERDEDFYAITLDIKNKKTIQEALDLYIKPDILEGDNKYHCEEHDAKISAQRRTYLKDLSNMVVINLKRFEFDYNTMQRLKVNDYCEFPERINFRKWTKEGIDDQMRREQDQSVRKNTEGDDQIIADEEVEINEDDAVDKYVDTDQTPRQETEGGAQMDQGIDFDDELDNID